jgi:hypothetical protein
MPERRAQQPPPTTVAITTAIEAVVERTAQNGRKYQAIEYVDPDGELKSVAVWDKKLLVGLEKGQVVELNLARKGSFWNLTGLTRLATAADAKSDVVAPPESASIPPPAAVLRPPTLRESLSSRDWGIASANSLTNAVNVVTAFKDVLAPADRDAVMASVVGFYHAFLELHGVHAAPAGEKPA